MKRALLATAMAATLCSADSPSDAVEPTNELPNPYRSVDAKGNVYGGEVGPRQLVKHLR